MQESSGRKRERERVNDINSNLESQPDLTSGAVRFRFSKSESESLRCEINFCFREERINNERSMRLNSPS